MIYEIIRMVISILIGIGVGGLLAAWYFGRDDDGK